MPSPLPGCPGLRFCASFLFLFLLLSSTGLAQSGGSVFGKVVDAADGSPLWGANVSVKGTSLGSPTDDEGRFKILNVPPGTVTIVASYLGYGKKELETEVVSDSTTNLEIRLTQSVIQGEEVVVTAQLRGQQAAINQQITSNSIVNVLSQERIRELPDQNAAEAIARLPGITVQRDGGEAQKVIIRGLSPKFSNITINGEKVPSTDLTDRSVDLSSISSDMLVGIEVYKSSTADKDGDAVGGTVNFAMKKALSEPSFDVRVVGGRNSLENDYGDYQTSVNLSDRLLDDALGVVLTANIQRANRGSDGQQEDYSLKSEPIGGSPIPYQIDDMRLVDRKEIRKRYGGSLSLDYNLATNHNLFFTGFFSHTDRDETRRRQRANVLESRQEYDYLDHVIGTQLYNVGLNGAHIFRLPLLGDLNVDWRVSASQSDQKNPFELYTRFFQMGFSRTIVADQGPERVADSIAFDPNNTWLKLMNIVDERVLDKNRTAQFDAKNAYTFGDLISGYFKFGVKYSTKSRERARKQIISNTTIETALGPAIFADPSAFYRSFPLTSDVNHKVLMTGFIDPNDQIGTFLGGKYAKWPTLSRDLLHEFWDQMRYWTTSGGSPLFDNNQANNEDLREAGTSYRAGEDIIAGYVMTEVSIGQDVMILPGLRYERTRNSYKSIFGTNGTTPDETPSIQNVRDSTGEGVHDSWLPMVQARVNVLEGLSVRASVARTLSRPNFYDLVPYLIINTSGSPRTIQKGNPSLKYTNATNYDLYLSLFNPYGLFAVGAFYKTLDNVSYIRTSYIFSGTYNGYRIVQPVNADQTSTVIGGEVEVQGNLTLLPEPFNSIVFAGNIAVMKSKTLYPRFQVTITQIIPPRPPFIRVAVVDTVREAPMPGQADLMGNLMLGYERGGFSGRISLVFQGRSLATVGTREETDGYNEPFYRWDLALKQKLYAGVSVFLNVNNITAVRDKSSNERFLTNEQYYGWGAELGLRYKF